MALVGTTSTGPVGNVWIAGPHLGRAEGNHDAVSAPAPLSGRPARARHAPAERPAGRADLAESPRESNQARAARVYGASSAASSSWTRTVSSVPSPVCSSDSTSPPAWTRETSPPWV